MRVINLSKGVGSTSCPWNDIYGTMRAAFPGLAYPSLAAPLNTNKLRIKRERCSGVPRNYFQAGLPQAILFLRLLSRRNTDTLIVHLHTPILVFVFIVARALGARLKLVTTQHNNWANFKPHQKLCLRLAASLSQAYVACGREVKHSLPASVARAAKRKGGLYSVPNGIPSQLLGSYAERRYKWMAQRGPGSEEARTIVVARMAPQKNPMHLLRLIQDIPELGKVTWFGGGPLQEEVLRERDRRGLQSRVELAGVVSREEVYQGLVEHDFYLTVSLWEGLSVADLEAVAIGCLPLMSDIPQRREIAEAVGFILLPENDLEYWRRTVQGYISMTSKERGELGLAFSKSARRSFSREAMVSSYADIYRTVWSKSSKCKR